MDNANGEIIGFLDSDDKLKPNCLEEVFNFYKYNKKDIGFLAIPMFHFDGKQGKHKLNEKFDKKLINVENESDIHESVASTFILKSKIADLRFNENLTYFENTLFLKELLDKTPTFALLNTTDYEYRIRRDNSALMNGYYHKDIYYKNFEIFLKSLEKDEEISNYSKNLIIYYLKDLLKRGNVQEVLDCDALNNFLEIISTVLMKIEDSFILNHENLNKNTKKSIIALKYPNLKIDYSDEVTLFNNNQKVDSIKGFFNKIIIKNAKLKRNRLTLRFYLNSVSKDLPELNLNFNNNYSLDLIKVDSFKLFSKNFFFKNYYELSIKLPEKSPITFILGSCNLGVNSDNVWDIGDYYLLIEDKKLYFNPLVNNYKISAIVNILNGENFIRCLDSLTSQTLENIEILCLCDKCNDELKEYSKKDSRIKILEKTYYNDSIKEAQGKYILFIDSIDYISKDFFEKSYKKAINKDSDIVISKFEEFSGQTIISLDFSHNFKNRLYKRSFLLKNKMEFSDTVFSRELFSLKSQALTDNIAFANAVYYSKLNNFNESDLNKKDLDHICNLINKQVISYDEGLDLIFKKFHPSASHRYYKLIKEFLSELSSKQINDLDSSVRIVSKNILKSDDFEEFIKLNEEKAFSVIMAVYNTEKFLREAIESIVNQTFGFENIELILIDDGSTDSSAEVCLEYENRYPNNVRYIYQENQGQAIARNNGMKIAKGKYLNFLDSDDKFSLETFKNAFDLFENNYDEVDVVSVPIEFFDRQSGEHVLNYKYKHTRIVDLDLDYDHVQLSSSSAFVKRSSVGNFIFDTELLLSEDAVFLNKILLEKRKLGVVNEACYYYRKRFSSNSTIDSSITDKRYFFPRFDRYFKELINYSLKKINHVPKFIQFTLMYDLQWMFKIEEVEDILDYNEIELLFSDLFETLQYIDNQIILNQRNIDDGIKGTAFIFKNKELRYNIKDGWAHAWAGDRIIDKLNWHKLYLDSVELKNGVLTIVGFLKSFFKFDDLKIYAVKKSASSEESAFGSSHVSYPFRDRKVLGKLYNGSYNFEINIPLNEKEDSEIELKVEYGDLELNLELFLQGHVMISEESNYFLKEDYIVTYQENKFKIENYGFRKLINYEKSNIEKLEDADEEIIELRKSYLRKYLFYKHRRIWLFMDRPDKADDNAEVLFKYCSKKKDGIKKYFIISKDSPDFNRLNNLKNVVEYGSRKHKLLYLFAEKIISSHPDENILNPFYDNGNKYIKGLITSEKYFLQHGVILHDISYWLHRYDKPLSLLVSSSKYEYNSLFEYPYNYSEDVVQITGLPRYDKLDNRNVKKQIIVMPTWRRSFIDVSDEEFKLSNYYEIFNSFFNNKELISYLKNKGYELIFRPHPNIMKFIECFDFDDNVKIDLKSKYRDLFNDSAMLITDYSSVAFDFAYLKKPILYYHFDDKGFHFDIKHSYFDYETMGFGEVVTNENKLIESIKKIIERNCKIEDVYEKRIDDFFVYTDKNNCKRVYDFIIK